MSLSINDRYSTESFQKSWIRNENAVDNVNSAENPTLIADPFRCFALPNFLDFSQYNTFKNGDADSGTSSCVSKFEKNFLYFLRDELESLELNEKNNDLYHFRQSVDLDNVNTPTINAFKLFVKDQVKTWLRKLTGIELNDRVAMTASAYGYGDYLLCHDDELEHRRIAYTFYLTPNWTKNDGGGLDLFSSDEKLRPLEIVHSIVPLENMFTFFEVVPKSFHQVSEVTSKNRIRWSINGWFHGAAIERPKISIEAPLKKIEPDHCEEKDLVSWINPNYLVEDVMDSIRQRFEENSEIQLSQFLQNERYNAIMAELSDPDLNWKRVGPWNRRNHFSLDDGSQLDDKRFPNLSFCLRLMRSDLMFALLSRLTNMSLHPLFCHEDESSDQEDENEDGYCPPTKKPAYAKNGDMGASCSTASANTDEKPGGSKNGKEESDKAKGDRSFECSPCESELRKFEPGSYTVLSDDDFASRLDSGEKFALDAQLCFTDFDWDTKHGGYTCYFESGSSEELLSVPPSRNALSLVCSEAGTQRFVKYINRLAVDDFGEESTKPFFVDICNVYYEAKLCAEDKDEKL